MIITYIYTVNTHTKTCVDICRYYICVYIAIALDKRLTGCSNLSETNLIPLPPSPFPHRATPTFSPTVNSYLTKSWKMAPQRDFKVSASHSFTSRPATSEVRWRFLFGFPIKTGVGGEFKVQVVVSFMNIKLEDWWYLENSWVNTYQYIFDPAFIKTSLTQIALCPIRDRWWYGGHTSHRNKCSY